MAVAPVANYSCAALEAAMPPRIPLRFFLRTFFCGIIILLSSSYAGGPAAGEDKAEYTAKATFLYNFCQFIQWPSSSFSSAKAPITIVILGDDPFGPLLEAKTRNQSARGRQIRILRTKRLPDVKQAHILFISQSETPRLSQVLASVRGRDVITVGETDEFLAAGGMIALKAEQGKVRLRINTSMVQTANVTVSSKLLRIATQR